jgi:ankyrin repeat protein
MTNSISTTKLLEAIKRHDLAGCQQALDEGADPNGFEREGFDPALSIAIGIKAPVALCILLIDRGADIAPRSTELPGPLFRAAKAGYLEMCKVLISRGAHPDGVAVPGSRPLHTAASEGHVDVCRYLIEQGANVQHEALGGWTPLHYGACGNAGGRTTEVCRLLVASGASPAHMQNAAHSPFHIAIVAGNSEVVDYFIRECGEKANQRTLEGEAMVDLTQNDELKAALRLAITEQAIAASIDDSSSAQSAVARAPQVGCL